MGRLSGVRPFLFLCLLATCVQVVALVMTQLPARDNTEFLRIAQSLQSDGVLVTIRGSIHHPLYPAMIVMVHRLAIALSFAESAELWQRCGQVAAAVPLIVLSAFTYLVGLRLFPPRVAFVGAALLCILPGCCLLGADGLSESPYLLFFFVGLWCSLQFVANPRTGWLLGAGLSSGFAYLARPEGLVISVAVLLTLALLQILGSWRISWKRLALGSFALIAGLLVVAAPYAMATGRVTGKRSWDRLLARASPALRSEYVAMRSRPTPPITSKNTSEDRVEKVNAVAVLPGFESLSFRTPSPYEQVHGYREAVAEYFSELLESLRYVFAALALVGACFPLASRPRPCDVLVLMIFGIFSTAVILSAAHDGYIGGRHVLTVASLVVFWSAHGTLLLIDGSAAWGAKWWDACRRFARSVIRTDGMTGQIPDVSKARARLLVEGVVFSAAVAFCMLQVAVPRRLAQTGHIKAARWIAENTPQDAVLLDTYGWASLLSDRKSYQYESLRQAFLDPRLRYVVIQAGELQENTDRAASLRTLLEFGGSLRGLFPGSTGGPEKTVSVYEWSPSRAAPRLANRVERSKTAKGI